ncbi:MAG: Threonine--tRNA ligase, partial [Verrucomicrobiota bacterium]
DSSKYTGQPALWDRAETVLREIAGTLGVPYSEEPGEAAFYGPKIDFVVKDVIGREWQLGTVQVDYNLPERFNLSYIGSDNAEHRPVMIHRAPFGSMERFTGVLIEHFAGNFPVWLAPEQVRILPITDDQLGAAEELRALLGAAKVRCDMDTHSDKFGAKVRRAELDRIPYMFVLGKNEVADNTVSIRSRVSKEDAITLPRAEAIQLILRRIAEKALPET